MATASEVLDLETILSATPAIEAAGDPTLRAKAEADETLLEDQLKNLAFTLRMRGDVAGWTDYARQAIDYLLRVSKQIRVVTLLLEAMWQAFGWEGLALAAQLYRRLLQEQSDRVRPPATKRRLDRHRFLANLTLKPDRAKGPPLGIWFVSLTGTADGRMLGPKDLELIERGEGASEAVEALAAWPLAAREAWIAAGVSAANEMDQLRSAILADLAADGAVPADVSSKLDSLSGDIRAVVERAKKVLPAISAQSAATDAVDSARESLTPSPQPTRPSTPASPRSRADVVRLIAAAARYFETSDPHSPVSYRLRTAERWLGTPLPAVMAQLLSDSSQLSEILRGLGVPADGSNTDGQPQSSQENVPATDPPIVDSRKRAIEMIETARRYLKAEEPHSLANFPLSMAAEVANLSLERVLERAALSGDSRRALNRELGLKLPET